MAERQRRTVAGRDVLLLGTIPSLESDGDEVRRAFSEAAPALLALGVPPEDLDGLRALAADPDLELPDVDPQTVRFMELLGRFGTTRIPSPDLEAAFAAAQQAGVPVEALDLDDEEHAEVYIRANRFRHIVQSGRVQRKLLKQDFADANDAASFVRAWDDFQNQLPSLRAVEAAREAHMADRLREVAASAPEGRTVLALVPLARMDGVLSSLDGPGRGPD